MKLYDLFTESTIDEVAMNPSAFAGAVEQGQTKGVLVGFEFEVLVPATSMGKGGKVIDQRKVQEIFSSSDFWTERDFTGESGLQDFNRMFKLRPGIKTNYESIEAAADALIDRKIKTIRSLFDQVPEELRKLLIPKVKRGFNIDFKENTPSSILKFGRGLGSELSYYSRYTPKYRPLQRVAEQLYREGGYPEWGNVFTEYLGKWYDDSMFTRLFDYDPAVVYKQLELSDYEDDFDEYEDYDYDYVGASKLLKPAVKKAFGRTVRVFSDYHEKDKNLKDWYIEPDGSLSPEEGDGAAEIVSPPMGASEAMTALKNFYGMAQQLKLYTNNSTGIHINISIPEKLDILKLAVFLGDQYVLKQFNRLDSRYAVSSEKQLQQTLSRANQDQKSKLAFLQRMADDATHSHTASISNNGKYISFRHAGGDYLADYAKIANTVGRFIRAMIIAADPNAYAKEYQTKLAKISQPAAPAESNLSTYLRTKGLPVFKIELMSTGRSKLSTLIHSLQLGLQQYQIHSTQTNSGEAKQLIVNAMQHPERKAQAQQLPEQNFITVTLAPTNEAQIKDVMEFSNRGVQRLYNSRSGYIGFALLQKSILPATDPYTVQALKQILQSRFKK